MVEKSPFISEKPEDAVPKFRVRDENIIRMLGDYNTESGALARVLNLTSIVASNKLGSTITYMRTPKSTGQGIRRKPATQAAWLLESEKFNFGRARGNQALLDFTCDLRLLKKMPALYTLHSNGHIFNFLNKRQLLSQEANRIFLFDRLLKEDGDVLVCMLKLLSQRQSDLKDSALGIKGKLLYQELLALWEQRKVLSKTNAGTRDYVMDRLEDFRHALDDSRGQTEFTRRMEVIYDTRRSWLRFFGLMSEQGENLTQKGEILWTILEKESLEQKYFETKFFSDMSRIFEIGSAEDGVDLGLLEVLFKEMTAMRGIDILETYVLLDAYLFSRIPRGFGEREPTLNRFVTASRNEEVKLVVQNGYRTNYYYVKSR